jgi:hypothetical protein
MRRVWKMADETHRVGHGALLLFAISVVAEEQRGA